MMALRATAEGGEHFALVIDKTCLHANNGSITKWAPPRSSLMPPPI
jgi:hypothetical protein